MVKHQNNYRYERKYLLERNQLSCFLRVLFLKNYHKIYQDRLVNNIYLDSYNFNSMDENIEGISKRKKTRIRWYGPKFQPSKKTLELKIKNEFLNKKKKYDLGVFSFNGFKSFQSSTKILKERLNRKEVFYANNLNNLIPTLSNSYKRSYYLNPNKSIRITIDQDLKYYSPFSKLNFNEKFLIVEIKYNQVNYFINNFNKLELTRYSKYVKGSLQTNFHNSIY